MAWLVEKAGEVLAAIRKAADLELLGERETNRAWTLRELRDLEEAARTVRETLEQGS